MQGRPQAQRQRQGEDRDRKAEPAERLARREELNEEADNAQRQGEGTVEPCKGRRLAVEVS